MTDCIYIDYIPGMLRAGCLRDDILVDLLILRTDKPLYIGNQYIGRIVSFDKGLDAAFVDIGLDKPGFLPRQQIPKAVSAKGISEGTYIVVEVTREAVDGKGVRLRAKDDNISSRKIMPLRIRDTLKDWLLRQKGEPEVLLVTDAKIATKLKAHFIDLGWDDTRVQLAADKPDLFDAYYLEETIEELLQVDVPLPSGGSLIIEQGRTLTAIDVNKGTMQHNGGAEALHYALNLEAASETARQLRLRNISGRILVDFPSMKIVENRKGLQGAFKSKLKSDPVSHKLMPLYLSGLQELTRKRAGHSLQDLLLQPIGIGGLGHIEDDLVAAYAVLRRIWMASISNRLGDTTIITTGNVIGKLENSQARTYIEDRIGQSIKFKTNSV